MTWLNCFQTATQTLTLHDMISICFDICKGCEYLEDLHFVHRFVGFFNLNYSWAYYISYVNFLKKIYSSRTERIRL